MLLAATGKRGGTLGEKNARLAPRNNKYRNRMRHPDFNPPGKAPKLTSRRSTLTGLFFTTLTPYIEPTEEEVDEALAVLGMKRGSCVCAYCGDKKSEWDHFRAVVRERKPTGYITEIANLVPACGKCNQSRGNKDWETWMRSSASKSPANRGVVDIEQRISYLKAFESWRTPVCIDYAKLTTVDHWDFHTKNLERVLSLLEEAERHALDIRSIAAIEARKQRDQATQSDILEVLNDRIN